MPEESSSENGTPLLTLSAVAVVTLLDGKSMDIHVDGKTRGEIIFEEVCSHLKLFEKEYFGLRYYDKPDHKTWLDLDKKVGKILQGELWRLDFEFKFYPKYPSKLKEDYTRYLLCLQVKNDIINKKLPCSLNAQAVLWAYLVQSQFGDYSPKDYPDTSYLTRFSFCPDPSVELMDKVMTLHKGHKGLTPEEAERHYLEKAKKLTMYGVDMHPAKDSEGADLQLGVCSTGILVYQDSVRINRFAWPKILKVSYRRGNFYKKNNFLIKIGDGEKYLETIGFVLEDKKAAKNLWKVCVEQHMFFRLYQEIQIKSDNSEKDTDGNPEVTIHHDTPQPDIRPTKGKPGSGSNPGQRDSRSDTGQLDSGSNSGQPGSGSNPGQLDSTSDSGQLGSGSNSGQPGSGSNPGQLDSTSDTGQLGSGSNSGQPGSGSNPGQLGSGSNTGQLGSGSNTGQLGSGSNSGQPGSGSNTRQPASGSNMGQTGSGSNTGQLGSGSNTGQTGSGSITGLLVSEFITPNPGSGLNRGQPYSVFHTGQPGSGTNTGQTGSGSNTWQPGSGTNTGQPGSGSNTWQPGSGTNTGQPGSGSNTWQAGSGSNTWQTGSGSNTGDPVSRPTTGQPKCDEDLTDYDKALEKAIREAIKMNTDIQVQAFEIHMDLP